MARSTYIYVVLETDAYGHDQWFHSAYTVKHEMISRFVKEPYTMPTSFQVLRQHDGVLKTKETIDITDEVIKLVYDERKKCQKS